MVMNRYIAAIGTFVLATVMALSQAHGQEELLAITQEVEGNVEVSIAGERWVALSVGDAVPIDTRISTGFRSRAVLAIGESTVLTVEPLTRLEIERLAVEEGVERSQMNLQVGRIRGEVERTPERPNEFELRSPVATASVRGTSFTFDGETLEVARGRVALVNRYGRERSIDPGEQSSSDGVSAPEAPAEERRRRATVTARTAGGEDEEEAEAPPPVEPDDPFGTVTIIIDS